MNIYHRYVIVPVVVQDFDGFDRFRFEATIDLADGDSTDRVNSIEQQFTVACSDRGLNSDRFEWDFTDRDGTGDHQWDTWKVVNYYGPHPLWDEGAQFIWNEDKEYAEDLIEECE